jgi:predicted transposase YdaD
MAEFDTIAKHLIHAYPGDFARFALQHDNIEVIDVIDTEQVTVRANRTDSLIRVQINGEEALVHHEFQTTDSSPPMPRRMVGYIGRSIEQYGLPIYSNVIYLRPDAGRSDPGYYTQQRHGFRVLVQYKVIRLIELDGQRILAAGPSGLLPFAPLMQRPAGVEAESWLRQCIHRAQQVPMDETVKANYLADLAILSGLVYKSETIMTILSEETMYESSVVQYFTEKGIGQGIQESIQEVLALRFQPEDMHLLASRIEAIEDVQRLKQLFRAAVQMPTLEAFRHFLDADE